MTTRSCSRLQPTARSRSPRKLAHALRPHPPPASTLQVLEYHVVRGAAKAADLADGQVLTTLGGGNVTVSIMDGSVFILSAGGAPAKVAMVRLPLPLQACRGGRAGRALCRQALHRACRCLARPHGLARPCGLTRPLAASRLRATARPHSARPALPILLAGRCRGW